VVVLVTGCRSGFGKLIAVEIARQGHLVYAGLRDLSTRGDLETAAAGLDVRCVQLDVTSAEERQQVVAQIVQEQGHIDGLVNNAGIALGGFLEQVESDELRKVFEVNVFGLWALTKEVLPYMRSQQAGKIINISSGSGFMAFPGLGAYAASKFALEGMTEAWRHELALFGIDIYLIQPGAYATDIWGRNRTMCRNASAPGEYLVWAQKLDGAFRRVVDKAVKRPDEVAHKVIKLLAPRRRRFRHPMGPGTLTRRVLKSLLPFWLVEFVVRRVLTKQ
jgi:NAD(P)-dependent dehydrogenase (short-subunit alcohol dehydrogenase family)